MRDLGLQAAQRVAQVTTAMDCACQGLGKDCKALDADSGFQILPNWDTLQHARMCAQLG